jgi:L-aminopeptidase/D-esterase-like protein
MATCQEEADPNAVGALAAEAVEGAIVRAVTQASSLCGFISYSDILKKAAQP